MAETPNSSLSRTRCAVLFGLEWAGGCLGLVVVIQVVGLLAIWLFAPGAAHADSGAAVFLTGLRVLAAFLAVALVFGAWRWASLGGRDRAARRLRRRRWRAATLVAAVALLGFSATTLRSQAPGWVSTKRPRIDCPSGDSKQDARSLAGPLKEPQGVAVLAGASAVAPCR